MADLLHFAWACLAIVFALALAGWCAWERNVQGFCGWVSSLILSVALYGVKYG